MFTYSFLFHVIILELLTFFYFSSYEKKHQGEYLSNCIKLLSITLRAVVYMYYQSTTSHRSPVL